MRWSLSGLAVAALLGPAPTYAKTLPTQTPIQQAIQADAVVVGRVVAFDSELVQAEPFPGAPNGGHAVATLHIQERLHGAAGLTHVRVAFRPAPARQQPPECCEVGSIAFDRPLELDQVGCFFLNKQPGADFFVRVYRGTPLNRQDDDYEITLETVRRALRVVDNPTRALRDREPSARSFAAAVLLQTYRAHRYFARGPQREEPLDAEESRLILRGLAGLEWDTSEGDPLLSLRSCWWTLGLTEADGWRQPTPGPQEDANAVMNRAARAWLVQNADRYHVRRRVAEDQKPADRGPRHARP